MQRQRGDSPTKGIPVFAVILMAAILIAAGCGQDLPQSITVVSWGGSYGRPMPLAPCPTTGPSGSTTRTS